MAAIKHWYYSPEVRQCRGKQAPANTMCEQRLEKFEFTACDTPQQNSLAEVGFVTLVNRGGVMMHHANLPMMDRYRLDH